MRKPSEHRLLRDVDAELARVAGGAESDVSEWLERKRDALLAHFEWEEEVVFPAVHGLLPGTEKELEQLERDHGVFLELLHRALAKLALLTRAQIRSEDLSILE